MIAHSKPSLGIEEEHAATQVIRSGMLAQGTEVEALEDELARFLGVDHTIAVSSGSAALHLALLALNIDAQDQVLIPSYVCTALLQAIRHVGAEPLLADIDPETLQLSPTDAHTQKTDKTKAIIAPHMFGKAVDLNSLTQLGVPIIEDCALSLGATPNGSPLGSRGLISTFSFYATKVICGGEGGALATSDGNLAEHLRDLRDYDGRYDDSPRFNYKMTDLQAAIVRVQLGKLPNFIAQRRELGEHYRSQLLSTQAHLPSFEPGEFPFRYIVRTHSNAEDLIAAFETHKISVRRPVFHPLHRIVNSDATKYQHTDAIHNTAISIPLYPALTFAEIDHILNSAQEVLCPDSIPMP